MPTAGSSRRSVTPQLVGVHDPGGWSSSTRGPTRPRATSSRPPGWHGCKGHSTGNLAPRAFTSAGSPSPLWDDWRLRSSDEARPGNVLAYDSGEPLRMDVDHLLARRGRAVRRARVHAGKSRSTFGGRESAVEASIRDPQRRPPLHETSGVRQRGEPPFPEPPLEAPVAAECPGVRTRPPAPSNSARQYAVGEWPGAQPEVVVTARRKRRRSERRAHDERRVGRGRRGLHRAQQRRQLRGRRRVTAPRRDPDPPRPGSRGLGDPDNHPLQPQCAALGETERERS